MYQQKNKFYIYHSPLLSLPFVADLFYILEAYLFSRNRIKHVFLSRKSTFYQNKILRLISKKSGIAVCNTYKFGRLLADFKSDIRLNFRLKKFEKLNNNDRISLMWSLVYAKDITRETKTSLKDFAPSDIPIIEKIVVSYRDPVDLVADYVIQTTRSLSKTEHEIYFVLMYYPIWVFKYLFYRLINRDTMSYDNLPKNIKIIHPFSLFPAYFEKIYKIKKINTIFSEFFLGLHLKRLGKYIFWSFDAEDNELLKSIKNNCFSLYDCVDYFTTQDPIARKRLLEREKKFIKSVNFFVTISKYLNDVKSKIRNSDLIVEQGFDLTSFKKLSKNRDNPIVKVPRPIVGYVGNLTYRIDYKLLNALVEKLPQMSFVFVGSFLKIPDDDKYSATYKNIERLFSHDNVYSIPEIQNKSDVSKVINKFNVGIIPYKSNLDFNKYCYPLKLFEYFYHGIPVISTHIGVVEQYSNIVKIGDEYDFWYTSLVDVLKKKYSHELKKLETSIAVKHSWDNRIKLIVGFLQKQINSQF